MRGITKSYLPTQVVVNINNNGTLYNTNHPNITTQCKPRVIASAFPAGTIAQLPAPNLIWRTIRRIQEATTTEEGIDLVS